MKCIYCGSEVKNKRKSVKYCSTRCKDRNIERRRRRRGQRALRIIEVLAKVLQKELAEMKNL